MDDKLLKHEGKTKRNLFVSSGFKEKQHPEPVWITLNHSDSTLDIEKAFRIRVKMFGPHCGDHFEPKRSES